MKVNLQLFKTIYTINVTNTCEKVANSAVVEHRAQSPVREFMLAVWPSIAEGFSTARSRDNLYN